MVVGGSGGALTTLMGGLALPAVKIVFDCRLSSVGAVGPTALRQDENGLCSRRRRSTPHYQQH